MNTQIIHTKVGQLSGELQREVLDYIEFLLYKYDQKNSQNHRGKKEKFRFDWEGGLLKLKGQYTSVELQHKALEWR